jgi:hypothetical protein
MSRDSSVGIAAYYGPYNPMILVRFTATARKFSLFHHVQIGSGAYPAFYPMGMSGSFSGGKAAGV